MILFFLQKLLSVRTIYVRVNDGKWRHICASWDNADGQWAFFKDGVVVDSKSGYKQGYVILPGGTLVLGQTQLGVKSFDPNHLFEGEMANFNLWSHYLTAIEVSRMSNSCVNGRGDVFRWSRFRHHGINGKVQVVRPSACAP